MKLNIVTITTFCLLAQVYSRGGRGGGFRISFGKSRFGGRSRTGSSKGSSYPKQTWGTSGIAPSGNTFVHPKSYGGYGTKTSIIGKFSGYSPTYSYRKASTYYKYQFDSAKLKKLFIFFLPKYAPK